MSFEVILSPEEVKQIVTKKLSERISEALLNAMNDGKTSVRLDILYTLEEIIEAAVAPFEAAGFYADWYEVNFTNAEESGYRLRVGCKKAEAPATEAVNAVIEL